VLTVISLLLMGLSRAIWTNERLKSLFSPLFFFFLRLGRDFILNDEMLLDLADAE
jgi:hypothetical protein